VAVAIKATIVAAVEEVVVIIRPPIILNPHLG
jgi:hypothetical protein